MPFLGVEVWLVSAVMVLWKQVQNSVRTVSG